MSTTSPGIHSPLAPILRLPAVLRLTGRARTTIYEDIAAGRFPKPIKLGPRSVGWLQPEVEAWLSDRVAARGMGEQS